MSKWENIWKGKSLENLNKGKSEFELFCDLKKVDGFDVSVENETRYYRNFYDEWFTMSNKIREIASSEINSVYEVGCGSGVNLFLFKNHFDNIFCGGIDYSENLINIAEEIVASDDLTCGEAKKIDPDCKYDVVLADSVFQYFPDKEYAEEVLRKMIKKANKVVYLGELHDTEKQHEWLENRRKLMVNYDEMYAGLDKLFYSKEWLMNIATEYKRSIEFTVSKNPEYWNGKYIFNCFIY